MIEFHSGWLEVKPARYVKMPLESSVQNMSNISRSVVLKLHGNGSIDSRSTLFPSFLSQLFWYYGMVILIVSVASNLLALAACLQSYSRNPSVMLGYLASLSVADLLFGLLAAFDASIHFSISGEVACKLEGFLTETSYTSTILILNAISYERMKVVATPILARLRRFRFRRWLPILVWLISLFLCSPLLFIYSSAPGYCTNKQLGILARQVFYCFQTFGLFFVSLAFMVWAHIKIFKALAKHSVFRLSSSGTSSIFRSEEKLSKMLVVVVVVFCVSYIPFITLSLMVNFGLEENTLIWSTSWKVSQLLVFTQSCINPFIYCFFSRQFRKACRDVLTCRCRSVKVSSRRIRAASGGTSLELHTFQNFETRVGAHEKQVTVL